MTANGEPEEKEKNISTKVDKHLNTSFMKTTENGANMYKLLIVKNAIALVHMLLLILIHLFLNLILRDRDKPT